MRYEGNIYRPPSEAYSYILQVTIGCAHNKCTFCSMYKAKDFRVRDMADILEDLQGARLHYREVRRIFLADGDALCLSMDKLRTILLEIKRLFPECQRVGVYATPQDIMAKSEADLKELHDLGVGIIYMGLESGDPEILQEICKGISPEVMIEAAQRVKGSPLKLSVTAISGLGGQDRWRAHGDHTAAVLSAMDPDYVGLLTLMVEAGTPLYEDVEAGRFQLLTPEQVLLETKRLVEGLHLTQCVFRSNHPSNYLSLAGTFPQDKPQLLETIDQAVEGLVRLNSEAYRRL